MQIILKINVINKNNYDPKKKKKLFYLMLLIPK